MTPLQQSALDWLNGDHTNIGEGMAICRGIPEASVFLNYAKCYSEDRQLREVIKFLTMTLPEGTTIAERNGNSNILYSAPAAQSSKSPAPNTKDTGRVVVTPQSPTPSEFVDETHGDRPQHFDSWFERMSTPLQEKVATLGDLHTKRKFFRSEVERLAADPNHSKEDMAFNATACVAYENKIQAIYDQADVEWNELNGRSVMDEVKKRIAEAERKADKEIAKTTPSAPAPKAEKKEKVVEEKQEPKFAPTDTSDEYLETLTYQQILDHPSLEDGPRKYWLGCRMSKATKYLRDKLVEPIKEKKIAYAKAYVADFVTAGKTLPPVAIANLKAAGVDFPPELEKQK